jgi:acetyl esterase/lipase
MTVSAGSYERNRSRDQLFSTEAAKDAADLYLQGWDPRDPLASPAFGRFTEMPPTMILASTDEVLADDALGLIASLSKVPTTVDARLVPGVPHVWPTIDRTGPASLEALGDIARFVARHCPSFGNP